MYYTQIMIINFKYSRFKKNMERLSHDLNLALDESNYGRQERRKFGLRRRTRSAGNLRKYNIYFIVLFYM